MEDFDLNSVQTAPFFPHPSVPMKIGVDGGGTKTELILIDNAGAVVSRHLADGCNPSVVGPERARQILLDALADLLGNRDTAEDIAVTRTLLCMAGSGDFWAGVASSLSGYGKVETVSDAAPALELATQGAPGLVLHAGTGSFVCVRGPDQSVHFCAGFGWRIGDPGSAQDIGRRALARAVAELQGWELPSRLSSLAREEFNTSDPGILTGLLHRDEEPNRLIGLFASRVSAVAADDPVARDLVLESATDLLRCAESAARAFLSHQSLDTLPAGLSGPILTQGFVAAALQARTSLPLRTVTEPPIEGVRRLLARAE